MNIHRVYTSFIFFSVHVVHFSLYLEKNWINLFEEESQSDAVLENNEKIFIEREEQNSPRCTYTRELG